MTVSRVINGESNVRPKTRELVRQAIEELEYAPNQAARNLAGANQVHIALLYSNPSASYLSEFLLGALEQSRKHNIHLLVEKCDLADIGEAVVRELAGVAVDGVLLPPPLSESVELINLLARAQLPVVAVATSDDGDNLSSVGIDDYEAARALARHVTSLGHRKIGFIRGDPNQVASLRREQGFLAALSEASIEAPEAYRVQGYFTYRSGLDAAQKLLDLNAAPTAIIASNDDMAAAVVAVAHRRGLDVPADLTVCGFDDTALATTMWPELTTIKQPIVDMSRTAVDLLLEKIRAAQSGVVARRKHVVMEFFLIRRQSDGAAPASPKTGSR